MSNEDVLFFWNMVSSTIQEEVADEVLKRIVELYVTIRGFHLPSHILKYTCKIKQEAPSEVEVTKKESCRKNMHAFL